MNIVEKQIDPNEDKHEATFNIMEDTFNIIFLVELIISTPISADSFFMFQHSLHAICASQKSSTMICACLHASLHVCVFLRASPIVHAHFRHVWALGARILAFGLESI